VLAEGAGRQERARRLRAARPELGGVAGAMPMRRRGRGAPPQVAGGGGGGGDAEGLIHGARGRAAGGAALRGHDGGAAGTRSRAVGAGGGSGGAGCCEGQRGQRRTVGGQRGAPPVGRVHDLDSCYFARAGAKKPVSSWLTRSASS